MFLSNTQFDYFSHLAEPVIQSQTCVQKYK